MALTRIPTQFGLSTEESIETVGGWPSGEKSNDHMFWFFWDVQRTEDQSLRFKSYNLSLHMLVGGHHNYAIYGSNLLADSTYIKVVCIDFFVCELWSAFPIKDCMYTNWNLTACMVAWNVIQAIGEYVLLAFYYPLYSICLQIDLATILEMWDQNWRWN